MQTPHQVRAADEAAHRVPPGETRNGLEREESDRAGSREPQEGAQDVHRLVKESRRGLRQGAARTENLSEETELARDRKEQNDSQAR